MMVIIKGNLGIFDSGLGGLSVLKEVIKTLPQYNYVYLGDNANVPYGDKSEGEIYELTKKAVDFLVKKDCHLIIVACNTVTTTALRKIQQDYLPQKYAGKQVLGVVAPAIEAINKNTARRLGIIATEATIRSRYFIYKVKKIIPKIKIFQKACPKLVPLIEKGITNDEELMTVLKTYLKPLLNKKIGTLILACTHYGLIKDKIRRIVGNKIKIISQSEVTASKLKKYLSKHTRIEESLSKDKQRVFYFSKVNKKYIKQAKLLLGNKININFFHQAD